MEPKYWTIHHQPTRTWNAEAWAGIAGKRAELLEVNMTSRHMIITDGASHLVRVEGDPSGRQWWMRPDEMTPE